MFYILYPKYPSTFLYIFQLTGNELVSYIFLKTTKYYKQLEADKKLSAFAKLFETFIHDYVFLLTKFQIVSEKHVFFKHICKKQSYILNLYMTIQMNKIYTDFIKAFDKIGRGILLSKLSEVEIGSMLQWIESYLINRSQNLEIIGFMSNSTLIFSGLPQGSHLRPLIIIYIYIKNSVLVTEVC